MGFLRQVGRRSGACMTFTAPAHTSSPEVWESSYTLLRGGRTGPAPSKVGSGDADVVLPRPLRVCAALLLQTVHIVVRVILLLKL